VVGWDIRGFPFCDFLFRLNVALKAEQQQQQQQQQQK
jgi:hypothetical protein